MARKKRSKKPRKQPKATRKRRGGITEWVGGRLQMPFYVTEGTPYRPEMLLWFELPRGLVVGHTLLAPDGPPLSLAETLTEAMRAPTIGPPRQPSRVRVASTEQAAEIRAAHPDLNVVVADTPELHELIAQMAQSDLGDEDLAEASYLEDGRVSEQAVQRLFEASVQLFQTAPWELASDEQVLRIDIPKLGVEGACISVMGAEDEVHGIVIFPSLIAFDLFCEQSYEHELEDGPLDLGTTMLSLTLERASDLPRSLRKEAARYGWPVASPNAYPEVTHRDRDGTPRPLTEHDIQVTSACASALARFVEDHGDLFERELFVPTHESYRIFDELLVTINAPYADNDDERAFVSVSDMVGEREPARLPSRSARNALCPCGSGKKYKKCCLRKDEAAATATGAGDLHALDERLVGQMGRFAARRFGDRWIGAAEDFFDPEEAIQLFAPWSVYGLELDGRPIVSWYLEKEGRRLSALERKWLEAQQAAWLSLWEVTEVVRGERIELRDLLSGEQRTVLERRGSIGLSRRDVLLARVVDCEGMSLLCGSHPQPLPPLAAAEVERRVRGRLRRKRDVPLDRLKGHAIGRYIIARWEEEAEELLDRRGVPPILKNADGEDLLLTVDHFDIREGARDEVAASLCAMHGVEPPEKGDSEQRYHFLRSEEEEDGENEGHVAMDSTIIGQAEISRSKLRLQSNSVARADRLRQRVEAACGDRIRYQLRDHSDPTTFFDPENRRPAATRPSEIPPEEANRVVMEYKERHYADWVDHQLPALGGKTPREAAKTKAGRRQVDLLLKDCENHEHRMPEGQRYDFSKIRSQLGLSQ